MSKNLSSKISKKGYTSKKSSAGRTKRSDINYFGENKKPNNKRADNNAGFRDDFAPPKGDNVEIKCTHLNVDGKGMVGYRRETIPVAYILPGEEAEAEITRNGSFYDSRILKLTEQSEDRVVPKCPYFYTCGGCQLQHMSNQAQNDHKQNLVNNVMRPFGDVEPIKVMDDPYRYRNKSQYTFARNRGVIISGFYKEYTHDVIQINKCIIQDPKAEAIVNTINAIAKKYKMQIYNEDTGNGFLRHVLVRTAKSTGEVMVVLVTSTHMFQAKNNFVKALRSKHPEITTVVMNINDNKTSAVLGEEERTIYGKGYIEDTLCGFRFQISPRSFYQINPVQTEKLYQSAIDFADLKGDEIVLDAYSGIGTISLIASKKAKEVVGIEINEDAVKNSIRNARINKINNTRFYQGDAGDFMVDVSKEGIYIDTVFMDPPRSGSNEKFLTALTELGPRQVIYISCNPVTQARDLAFLVKNGYEVKNIQPVDMFPQTGHVENIVKLLKSEVEVVEKVVTEVKEVE